MGRKQGIDKSRVSFINATEYNPPSPSLESLVGAVGTHPISLIIPIMLWADIPIKGEQPSGTKHWKRRTAAIRQVTPRFTSSRGSRQIMTVGRERTLSRLTCSFRFVTWHAGMRDNYSKMRVHCVEYARAGCNFSGIFLGVTADFVNSRRKICRFKEEIAKGKIS